MSDFEPDFGRIREAARRGSVNGPIVAKAIDAAIREYHRQITQALTLEDIELNPKQAAALESFGQVVDSDGKLHVVPAVVEPTYMPEVSGPEVIGQ